MTEIYKKKYCVQFFKAYDLLLEHWGTHISFISFFKNEFSKETSREYLHQAVLKIFLKFTNLRIINDFTKETDITPKMQSFYRSKFNECFKEKFGQDFPDDPAIQKKILYKSYEPNCFIVLDHIDKLLLEENDEGKEKLSLFLFLRNFSKFIYYNKNEPVEYFKRFLFDYPFDAKGIDCKENQEWINKHQVYFNNLINEQDVNGCRIWFKNQLEAVKFINLTEEQKSAFFKEMFIAFGNISAKKSGGIERFVTPLKNLFKIGRYYNVHAIPFKYIDWTGDNPPEQKTLQNIAYFSALTYKNQKPLISNNKAQTIEQESHLAIEPGRSARRINTETIKKMHPYGESLDEQMTFAEGIKTLKSKIPLQEFIEQNFSNIQKTLSNFIQSSSLGNLIKNMPKKDKDILTKIIHQINYKDLMSLIHYLLYLNETLAIDKPGLNLLTHYDIFSILKNPNFDIYKIGKDLLEPLSLSD